MRRVEPSEVDTEPSVDASVDAVPVGLLLLADEPQPANMLVAIAAINIADTIFFFIIFLLKIFIN